MISKEDLEKFLESPVFSEPATKDGYGLVVKFLECVKAQVLHNIDKPDINYSDLLQWAISSTISEIIIGFLDKAEEPTGEPSGDSCSTLEGGLLS